MSLKEDSTAELGICTLLQRADKQEEEAQQNQQQVDYFALEVLFVEEECAAEE